MNRLCEGLIKKSFQMGQRHFITQTAFLFSSSKYGKPSKAQTAKTQQTSNKQILKASITTPNANKSTKSPSPQQANQKGSLISQQEKKQLALKQKLQTSYTQIQSFPTDSYETVMQNFKRVKARLNDRKVYVPNKPVLLTQIDKNMQLIRKHHKVWRSPSTQTERALSDSKKQIIEFELQQAKKEYYLQLLSNEKALIGAAAGVILVVGCFQYFFFIEEEEDPKLALPKMFL